jgi:hypothetical protein
MVRNPLGGHEVAGDMATPAAVGFAFAEYPLEVFAAGEMGASF